MYGLRASEVDDDVESQRPSKETMMMMWMRTTMPMNMMMIVIMMVMAQWGIEAWASETALGQRGWEDDTRALIPKGEQRIRRAAARPLDT